MFFRHRFLGAFACLAIAASMAQAEEIAYVRSDGGVYFVDTDDPENPFRINPDAPTNKYGKQNQITFNVTFEDVQQNTGIGFNDPTQGEAFRNRLGDVFTHLSSILDHTGTIDVLMMVSTNDPNSGTLASAGPGFPTQPGISNGFAFERLTTGVDQFPDMAEIMSDVNFGNPWFPGTGTPPNDQFDFFTTMLHEIAHGLGVLGLLDENGETGVPGVFTTWDTLTTRGINGPAIVSTGANPAFVGTVADLTSDDLFFSGAMATAAFGMRPAIFAPNPFQGGSSLSHFDEQRTIPGQIIMGPSGGPGVEPRVFNAFELGALQDLGYRLKGVGGGLTVSVTPATLNDVPAAGATQAFQITFTGDGDMAWTAAASQNWITLDVAAGTGNGTVTATIAANTETTPDSATITITAAGASNSPRVITVNQLGVAVAGCSGNAGGFSATGNAGDLLALFLALGCLTFAARLRRN